MEWIEPTDEELTVYGTYPEDDPSDDYIDQPLEDGEVEADADWDKVLPATLAGSTPYTSPEPPMTYDGTELPEPLPDDSSPLLPGIVTSAIRTVVPYIIAGVIWLLAKMGLNFDLPATFEPWLVTVLGTLYYLLARNVLEKHWPSVPWLGSTAKPLYTPPTSEQPAFATLASNGLVWYKGGRFTPAFRDMLVELDRLTPNIPIVITQGGFNGTKVGASAGTHAGDSVDISVRGLNREQVSTLIKTARMIGLALYFRTTRFAKWGTRAQGFSNYHLHGIPNGWGSPSLAAKKQVAYISSRGVKHGYRYGRDGLARNQADLGPGHVSTFRQRTWAGYKALKKAPAPTPVKVPPIPRIYTAKPWPAVLIDGVLGTQTIKRLQMQLNVALTGKLDHYTVRALRVWLNQPELDTDGVARLTDDSVRALQYRVGTTRDGAWGKVTTRALQEYLNRYR